MAAAQHHSATPVELFMNYAEKRQLHTGAAQNFRILSRGNRSDELLQNDNQTNF
jgi:hypothetical protein